MYLLKIIIISCRAGSVLDVVKINAPWKGSCDCVPEEKSNWHDLPGDVWNPGGFKIEDYPKVVYTANEIDPCEHCSNNPKNGGSGYCNCTLGERDKVTC